VRTAFDGSIPCSTNASIVAVALDRSRQREGVGGNDARSTIRPSADVRPGDHIWFEGAGAPVGIISGVSDVHQVSWSCHIDVHAVDRVVVERVIDRSALALLYRRCQRSGRGVARGRYLPFNQADECRHAHVAAGR
jgi:hypothetical protein